MSSHVKAQIKKDYSRLPHLESVFLNLSIPKKGLFMAMKRNFS